MQHQLRTEIDIEASPDTVWEILSDLDQYQTWNPFIVSATGTVAVGEKLTNRLQPAGGRAATFKPTVTDVATAQVLEWLGRFGMPGIFDGRHRFELAPTPNGGTHLLHTEHFSGALVRLMRKSLDTHTVQGFHDMNAALKARAEACVVSTS
jgi:hypothetical protein